MKILFTAYSPLGVGGAEVSMSLLAKGLKERGNEILIASTGDYAGFKTYKFKRFRNLPLFSLQKRYLSNFLIKIIKKESIDVIHAHDRLTIPAAIIVARKTGIKCVIHFRDHWFMCPKSVSIMHDYKECKNCSFSGLMSCFPLYKVPWEYYKLRFSRSSYKLLNSADCKISPSRSLKDKLEAVGIKDVKVIANPVLSMKGKNIREKLGFKKDDIIVTYIGALNRDKGILNILKVMDDVLRKNVKFLVVGNGSLFNVVSKFAESHKGVKLIGFRDYNEVANLYASSDIIVFPSLQESFGRISVEVMSAGKPIIGSNVTGIKDVINNKVGYLVNPLDLDEWKKRIIYLVENKRKRLLFGRNGLIEAKKYNYKNIALETEHLYKSLKNGKT